jgi:serine/threonine-protein kinase RsbW
VPANKDYIFVVRSAVAQLSAAFGFTIGEISDVRLAVDEACNLLVAGHLSAVPDQDLQCRVEVRGDLLHVTVAAASAGVEVPDTDDFGWNILTALVDSLAWAREAGMARVELEKRHGFWCA